MVAAIKQKVTIRSDGTLEIRSPELRAGEHAEVIILLRPDVSDPASISSLSPLQALRALQSSLKLTPEAARQWIEEAGAERRSWGNRG